MLTLAGIKTIDGQTDWKFTWLMSLTFVGLHDEREVIYLSISGSIASVVYK